MKKRFLLALATSTLLIFCKHKVDVPEHFKSYDEAEEFVKGAGFPVEENADVKSDWIESAKYFSNGKEKGFLIINMKGREYIFEDVPYSVWQELKTSDDTGRTYNELIRGNYSMSL